MPTTRTCGYLLDGSAAAAPNYNGAGDIQAAIDAADAGDTIDVYCFTNAKCKARYLAATITVNKAVTIRGALPGIRIDGNPGGTFIFTCTETCTINDLSIGGYVGIYLNTAGKTVTANRMHMDSSYGFYCTAGTGVFNNSVGFCAFQTAYCAGGALTCNFVLAVHGGNNRGFLGSACYNCIAADCVTGFASCTGTNNAAYDGTAPGAGSVNINTNDPAFWRDISTSFNRDDYRITTASSLATAGVAVVGVTTDFIGRTRADPPSIGPFEKWDPPTELAVTNVKKDVAYVILDGTTSTGTYEATSDYPAVSDVRLGVQFDSLSKTGTCRVPAVGKVESGYAYDASDSLIGTMFGVNPSVTIPAPTPVQLLDTETTIYTCPADTVATVKVLRLANCHSSAVTATIYKVVSGDSAADDTTQTKTRALGIAGSATADDEMGPFTLTAGDKISGLANVASKVTCTAEVYEVNVP